jgi:thioredoxin 1|tara:strand:- start:1043 stop:1414 length:372 start_codon:yes stop_codon:yes gene_type:complete
MKKILVILVLLIQFPANAADKYTNFSLSSLEKAKNTGKTVVVNSYEPWCWSCRKQDKVLIGAKDEFKGVVFLTYQQGKHKDIAEALNISVRTTIVVFKGKKEVARIIGQTGKTEIYSAIKKGI